MKRYHPMVGELTLGFEDFAPLFSHRLPAVCCKELPAGVRGVDGPAVTATVDLDEDHLGTVSASSGGEAVHDSAAARAR